MYYTCIRAVNPGWLCRYSVHVSVHESVHVFICTLLLVKGAFQVIPVTTSHFTLIDCNITKYVYCMSMYICI